MTHQTAASAGHKIGIGDAAPNATLTNTRGETVMLSGTWADKPVVLVFLKHFGCTFCREQVALIRRDYQKIVAAGMDVVCVAIGSYKVGKAFEIYFDMPFPVLVAEDNTPFAAYGLDRVNMAQLLSASVILKGFAAMFKGHIQGRITSDPMQMPGTFIVDTDGIIRFAHRNRDAADHTTVPMILVNAPATEGVKGPV